MTKDSIKSVFSDVIEGTILGGGSSAIASQLLNESVHFIFVIMASLLGAVIVFFTNKLLKKYFP